MDALLSAYRVGARVAWRELSSTAVAAGLPAETVARFAELVFAFIDELSAVQRRGPRRRTGDHGTGPAALPGTAGQTVARRRTRRHAAGQCRQRGLAAAGDPDRGPAGRAPNPRTGSTIRPVDAAAHRGSPRGRALGPWRCCWCPILDGRHRGQLRSALQGRRALVGPARPWMHVESSYRRALRARELRSVDDVEVVDTDEHLVELVLTADREAADDLRRQVLAPLADLRPNTADRLAETLRSWLLHQGQRDAVAADLFVHAQTVRYRMSQLRELYGDRLNDPQTILELTVALGIRPVAS